MNVTKPLISPIRSILIRVRDVSTAKNFYEYGMGLQRVIGHHFIKAQSTEIWEFNSGQVNIELLAQPGNPYGMIELVEWSDGEDQPIRSIDSSLDFGLFTVSYCTSNMQRALSSIVNFGAKQITEIRSYQAGGKNILETTVVAPFGERITLLQVGDVLRTEHPLREAVATVSAIVPSLQDSLRFYRDVLGLSVALNFDQSSDPFSSLLGAPSDTRLQKALLTSEGLWTGKFEFLQLTNSGVARDANADVFGRMNGYWMISVLTEDLSKVIFACQNANATIVSQPKKWIRPFIGDVQSMIVRAPGGELIEVIEP